MKLYRLLLFGFLIVQSQIIVAQSAHYIDKEKFFLDDKPVEATLVTDLGNIMSTKSKTEYQDATLTCKLPDSAAFTEGIRIRARGEFRRKTCYIPSLRLNFHNTTSPRLSSLDALKLVCACKTGNTYEQYLLKEYIIYKIYNLLNPKSFRVRLIKMNYQDSKGKKKPMEQYAFFIEDIKAMAKRNHCKEYTKDRVLTEQTNRAEMTMVSVFEYMIANTDWAVPVLHNIRLIYPKADTTASPYAVPYDFDFAGLVNTDYAIPAPGLEIESVRQRLYRGFPRTMAELQQVFAIYRQQKDNIYALINNFDLITPGNRKDMINFLDEFYRIINDQSSVQTVFIDNARTE
ncbi:MAG: hypothetical protein JST75_10545 [Bacteroidetes bacterium]|nr:hypothetical protein [Bacteroidota bacterium]